VLIEENPRLQENNQKMREDLLVLSSSCEKEKQDNLTLMNEISSLRSQLHEQINVVQKKDQDLQSKNHEIHNPQIHNRNP
jgi:hypothetical protein